MGTPQVTPLYEAFHDGGFIVSQANGHRSVDRGTLSGSKLLAGTVLGQVTASGKWVILAPAADDGSQNAAGFSYATVDASTADKTGTVVVRDAEVNGNEIIWPAGITGPQKTTALGKLAALSLIVR